MPDTFIEFFTSKITKIRENFSSDTMQSFSDKPFCGNSLSNFNLLSSNEVRSLIMSSPVKSCSLDPLPTSLLVQNLDFMINCITSIVNDSLSSGTMPDCLKHAIISPLLKKKKP